MLLKQAIAALQQSQSSQQNLITSLLSKDGKTLDLTLKAAPGGSITIDAKDKFLATNIMVSDTGRSLSVASDVNGGRLLGYGFDVIKQANADKDNYAHQPILQRSFNWLLSGKADQKPSGALTIAGVGHDKGALSAYFQNTYQITPKIVDCNLFDKAKDCWKNADLLVISDRYKPSKTELANLETTFARYQNGNKPLFYSARYWSSGNDGRTQFLTQYGVNPAGYPGNYFVNAKDLTSSNNRQAADIAKQSDSLSVVSKALIALRDNKTPSEAELKTMFTGIAGIRQALRQKNEQGQPIFANKTHTLLQKLVLLADGWRDGVRYDGFNKQQNRLRYLKTYIADAWQDFNRAHAIAPSQGAGDYMPLSAYNLPVSKNWETITLTLPQSSGYTAIGRAAIPAKGVEIKVVKKQNADAKDGNVNLMVQTSYVRTNNDKGKKAVYQRPDKSSSTSVALSKKQATQFVSPYGGPLFLRYRQAQAGQTVTLKIKGVAKYAHFDFVKGMNQSEMNQAIQALQSGKFGWNTMKFTGGEIQQTIGYAQKSVGNRKPQDYIDRIKAVIFDSNHIANGYNNMKLDATTQQRCTQLGWDCTGKVHNAPSVQHFVGWLAACGYLCSGQPVDAFTGIDTGWGWVHELGHNTVTPVLSMTFKSSKDGKNIGCGSECDNNILAGLSFLRKYELYGEDDTGHNFGHYLLFQQLVESRKTGKQGEALRLEAESRIWSGGGYDNPDAKRAVHMQLAFLYTKLHQRKAKPDAQGVLEFFRLLNIGYRLTVHLDMAKASAADKAKLGLGAYTQSYDKREYNNPELAYVLSSKILGYDLVDVFTLYGLPLSDKAKQSVGLLNLPKAPLSFYAQAKNEANLLAKGQWINNLRLQGNLPAYPFNNKKK